MKKLPQEFINIRSLYAIYVGSVLLLLGVCIVLSTDVDKATWPKVSSSSKMGKSQKLATVFKSV